MWGNSPDGCRASFSPDDFAILRKIEECLNNAFGCAKMAA
jgi:hypothetical protein